MNNHTNLKSRTFSVLRAWVPLEIWRWRHLEYFRHVIIAVTPCPYCFPVKDCMIRLARIFRIMVPSERIEHMQKYEDKRQAIQKIGYTSSSSPGTSAGDRKSVV